MAGILTVWVKKTHLHYQNNNACVTFDAYRFGGLLLMVVLLWVLFTSVT